jgi:hypothetical protein
MRHILALLAVLGQILIGPVAARAMMAPPAPGAYLGTLCHDASQDARPGQGQQGSHDQDCALCPLCVGVHLPAPLLPAPVLLPPRADPVRLFHALLPPPIGPPSRLYVAAQPRAPPALI